MNKQYVYHFSDRDSIDVRDIKASELSWVRSIYALKHVQHGPYKRDFKTAHKLLEDWYPEFLI